MRSIRFSLIVYFILLLGVALGVSSILLYRMAEETLEDKRNSTRKLIRAQYEQECQVEENQLNNTLLFQAQTIGRLAQFQTDWTRLRYKSLHVLGLLSSIPSPNGHLTSPLWIGEGVRGWLSYEMVRPELTLITLDETDLWRHVDGQLADFFQIDTAWKSQYRSSSLEGRSFPGEPRQFARGKPLAWEFETFELRPGVKVRSVILKTPATSLLTYAPMPPSPPRRRDRQGRNFQSKNNLPPPVPSPPVPLQARPAIFIQCARDLQDHDARLAALTRDRDEQLASVNSEAAHALSQLRNRLYFMSAAIFLAVVLGAGALVRLGLSPLRRLSCAVGKVSPRDFQLPLNDRKLPHELQPIAERLKATLAMLNRAFQREKQSTADISHELRTPLAALLTTIDLGLRKPRDPEHHRELLLDCRQAALSMKRIVDRLLVLARLDAAVECVRPQVIDVADLAARCVSVIRPLAEAKGLTIQLHSPVSLELQTDPDKIQEVLTNLLHNAIQYNRPNGSIDLILTPKGGQVHIAVQDTGIGMNPETQNNIFERFYRADKSRTGDGLHAGLGLAIVKEYVDLLGGTIKVESTEGMGSIFNIALPVSPVECAA